MKKNIFALILFALVFMTNFVSAAFHYRFGFFDISIVADLALIVLFFLIIFGSLTKVNHFGKSINLGLAGASSFLIYYWGFYLRGFDLSEIFSNFLFNFGLSGDFFYLIISLVLITGLIFFIWKFGFKTLFLTFGILLIALASLTDIFYEKGTAFVIGAVLVGIGLLIWWKGRGLGRIGRKSRIQEGYDREPITDPSRLLASPKRRGWTGASETLAYNYDAKRNKKIKKDAGWFGRKSKQEWQKEKDVMGERGRKAKEFTKRQIEEEKRVMTERAAKAKEFAKQQWEEQKRVNQERKEKYKQWKENKKVGKLKKRLEKIEKRLNSMPGGLYIKKGSPGYKEYISLYREAQDIRNKLGIN